MIDLLFIYIFHADLYRDSIFTSLFPMDLMDVTASSSFPTYSSTARWKYDVFLSFRGEDTRKTFTDLIYDALRRKSINTFKDDKDLEKGETISQELSKAIEESRSAIVILSKKTMHLQLGA